MATDLNEFSIATGQAWSFEISDHSSSTCGDARTPPEIVVAAVVAFEHHDTVICCSVRGAAQRQPDGTIKIVDIPFLPQSEPAFRATVSARSQVDSKAVAGFQAGFDTWAKDPRGLSVFTVPFRGSLDKLIARQMQAIVGRRAA